MTRLFSAWGKTGDKVPHTLAIGEGPPRFANGQPDPDCEVCLWQIEVGSFEEARAIFNLRSGFEPYAPVGSAAPCPNCGALFYPEASGQCWNCDYIQ